MRRRFLLKVRGKLTMTEDGHPVTKCAMRRPMSMRAMLYAVSNFVAPR